MRSDPLIVVATSINVSGSRGVPPTTSSTTGPLGDEGMIHRVRFDQAGSEVGVDDHDLLRQSESAEDLEPMDQRHQRSSATPGFDECIVGDRHGQVIGQLEGSPESAEVPDMEHVERAQRHTSRRHDDLRASVANGQ